MRNDRRITRGELRMLFSDDNYGIQILRQNPLPKYLGRENVKERRSIERFGRGNEEI